MKNPLKAMKADWAGMSPSQKAWAVTGVVAITAINPLYPLVYGATYGLYSARGSEPECTCPPNCDPACDTSCKACA